VGRVWEDRLPLQTLFSVVESALTPADSFLLDCQAGLETEKLDLSTCELGFACGELRLELGNAPLALVSCAPIRRARLLRSLVELELFAMEGQRPLLELSDLGRKPELTLVSRLVLAGQAVLNALLELVRACRKPVALGGYLPLGSLHGQGAACELVARTRQRAVLFVPACLCRLEVLLPSLEPRVGLHELLLATR